REFESNGRNAFHSDGSSVHGILGGTVGAVRLRKICSGSADLEIADDGARRLESTGLNGEMPMVPFWLPLVVILAILFALTVPFLVIISLMSLQALNRSPFPAISIRAWLAIAGVFLCIMGALVVANGVFLLWTRIPFYFVQGILG